MIVKSLTPANSLTALESRDNQLAVSSSLRSCPVSSSRARSVSCGHRSAIASKKGSRWQSNKLSATFLTGQETHR